MDNLNAWIRCKTINSTRVVWSYCFKHHDYPSAISFSIFLPLQIRFEVLRGYQKVMITIKQNESRHFHFRKKIEVWVRNYPGIPRPQESDFLLSMPLTCCFWSTNKILAWLPKLAKYFQWNAVLSDSFPDLMFFEDKSMPCIAITLADVSCQQESFAVNQCWCLSLSC